MFTVSGKEPTLYQGNKKTHVIPHRAQTAFTNTQGSTELVP